MSARCPSTRSATRRRCLPSKPASARFLDSRWQVQDTGASGSPTASIRRSKRRRQDLGGGNRELGGGRFHRAIAAIDVANAEDPNRITVRGTSRQKEQAHAELVTEWVRRLRPGASEALLLAARA